MTPSDDWRRGRENGYPICCILRYCLDNRLGRPAAYYRGGRERDERLWVPCGVFHRRDDHLPPRPNSA